MKSIKVFTITTHYANNQGAMLQAYSLNTYLNQLPGVDAKIINYFREAGKSSWKLLPTPKSFIELLLFLYNITQVKWLLGRNKKLKSMRNFWDKYLNCTDSCYNKEELDRNPPQGDVYICGSDQIWNTSIIKDDAYFLKFAQKNPSAILAAYAASISDPWTKENEEWVAPFLKHFNKIAIREKGNLEQVKKVVPEIEPVCVCDPVFLLSTNEWDKIAKEPRIKGKYILCYFLNIDPIAVKFVEMVRKQTGFKVVNLVIGSHQKFHSDYLVYDYNPCDFIGYIKNAEFIITNSFHCSAFSSMYKKNFRFIPKNWANERLLTLEEMFGYNVIMTPDKVNGFKYENSQVDYSNASKMDEYIQFSKKFIDDLLEIKR